MSNSSKLVNDNTGCEFVLIIAAIVLLIGVGGWIVRSHFEAKTYTRLTGKQVSTWEAMWVELRVTEPAMGD